MADGASGGNLEGRSSAAWGRAEREQAGGLAPPGPAAPRGPESALKEWIGLLARASFWALLIYQFVFQVSVVRGSSMEPNFLGGDRLLIDKIAYRFSEPRTGDVVVFEAMVRDDQTGKRVPRDYIKRVIAGPGDVVRIFAGAVHVNGLALDESAWGPKVFGGWEPFVGEEQAELFVVPPGRYFVMGDNRSERGSEDSRGFKLGYVAAVQLKGRVRWRFYPFGRLTWF